MRVSAISNKKLKDSIRSSKDIRKLVLKEQLGNKGLWVHVRFHISISQMLEDENYGHQHEATP